MAEAATNIHPDDLKTALARFELHRDEPEEPYDVTVRYRHKSGGTVWVRCRGLIIRDEAGTPVRMLGAHTDVTELKKAEQRLAARNAELERSNRELDEIARVMAHDLRAPLRAITAFGGMLATEHRESLQDEAKQYLDFVTNGAERMQTMVDGLLKVARLDGQSDAPEELSLADVLDEAQANLVTNLAVRGRELTRDGDFGRIWGIRVQLVQLVQNLIENAIKFSPDAPCITVLGRREAGWAVFEFIDEGVGFPAHAARRFFNVFERTVTREEFSGTGVGLSICKKVVDRHEGHIEAHGLPGKVARFVVRLPRHRPRHAPGDARSGSPG